MLDFLGSNEITYSSIGDISAISLCIVMGILVWQTYLRESPRFKLLLTLLTTVYISTFSDLAYDYLLRLGDVSSTLIYLLRITHHTTLLTSMYLYIRYLQEPLWIPQKARKRCNIISLFFIAACFCTDIVGIISKKGFHITESGDVIEGPNTYTLFFSLFFLLNIILMFSYKSQVIDQIFYSMIGVNLVSLLLVVTQLLYSHTSFTCLACFFPIINLVFMFHSNPYDVETGAVSERYFDSELKDCINKKENFILVSCKYPDFSKDFYNTKETKAEFNRFFRHSMKRGILYHFTDNRFILVLKEKKAYDSVKTIDKMKADFRSSCDKLGINFKIVILPAVADVTKSQDYLKLIKFIENDIEDGEIKDVDDDDIIRFHDTNYILTELEDIVSKNDLSDERVLVYCQPVYNITTLQYDTAEALMRLRLPKIGIVYPDKFIPIAEQNNMIHALSMIILNKTCASVRDFIEEEYFIRRVSVNFSVLDIKYDTFCNEVKSIIERNCIPYDKIAVEITESRSEADFNVMKIRVMQLQELGIKFYLDDFGTGYSNFERIMEIPFDIIKFDRSLLIESTKNVDSGFMVNTFADMFNKLDYAILFEGVENDADEVHCINMNAKYLQGYKYSKPIPIDNLKSFLRKTV